MHTVNLLAIELWFSNRFHLIIWKIAFLSQTNVYLQQFLEYHTQGYIEILGTLHTRVYNAIFQPHTSPQKKTLTKKFKPTTTIIKFIL